MKDQSQPSYQKKIKDYVISYCPTQYYGKNIHGEIRAGYKTQQHKIVIFRIVALPLTPATSHFLHTQQHYSDIGGFARTVHEPLHSSSNHYVPMEYFPKTFQSQKGVFRTNSKYLDEYVEKFLRVYAFFYNMKVTHGNLNAHNIGITFDGKVKLMDFGVPNETDSFEIRANKDFMDFKDTVGMIMEKEDHFPAKFSSFNQPQHQNWQHLFSQWHVTSPLEPLYLPRKNFTDNIVTLLSKLGSSLEEDDLSTELRLAVRLLMANYLRRSSDQRHKEELFALEQVVGKCSDWDWQRLNSVIEGGLRDPDFYGLSSQQRLVLICCLLPGLNHEYLFFQLVNEWGSKESRRNQMLAETLITTYRAQMMSNLLTGE